MSRGEQTKEQILDGMARLVATRGFNATSVNDVLEASGVTRGSLYFHFPGKDDLGLAVLERAREGFLAFLKAALVGPTPWDRLTKFFSVALKTHRQTGFVGGCLWGNTALEMSDQSPAFAAKVSDVFDEWTALLADVVRDGQKAGQIRADRTSKELATFIISAIEGGIMLSRLRKSPRPMKNALESLKMFLGTDTE